MVNRPRENGVSLIEILIASILGAAALLLISRLYKTGNQQLQNSQSNLVTQSGLNAMAGNLQKFMASGDLRFMGFTGKGAADKSRFRLLIPQYGRCADQVSTGCPDDTSFLYVHYDKLTTPTVTALCAVDDSTWVIDLKSETHGPAVFTPGAGFSVSSGPNQTFVAGLVKVGTNQPMALMNSPFATVWVAQSPAAAMGVTQDAAGNFSPVNPFGTGAPDCLANLKITSAGPPVRYDLSQLYLVSVKPLALGQFTGGATPVSSAEIATARGRFPLRIFNASLRAVGIGLEPASNSKVLEMRECGIASGSVVCSGTSFFKTPGIKSMRVDLGFHVQLQGKTSSYYEIIDDVTKKTCRDSCEPLLVASSGIPVLYTPAESFEQLDGAGYSFLKNDALSKIRFRVRTETKEQNFEVAFP